MKKKIIGLVILYSITLQAQPSQACKQKAVSFKTDAARQAYNDCMNGTSGDFAKTGCKSEQCRKACKDIGATVDAAKKEEVYEALAVCVYDSNERSKYGNWLPRGCHIRGVRCFHECLSWARGKKQCGITITSKPFPVNPCVCQKCTSSKKTTSSGWFFGGNKK